MPNLTRLDSSQADFSDRLTRLLQVDDATDAAIDSTVAGILADVKTRGDAAVLEYTARFDRLDVSSMGELDLAAAHLHQALDQLPSATRQALEAAAERVRSYHQRQLQHSWTYTEDDGTVLGQQITPLDRVGLYVPGGKAAYPSSVLMNAIPAKVAGVAELIMVVPTPGGEQN
ncbi:MAG: histidinol dehydrogenase, partial [Thiobacillus sp.]